MATGPISWNKLSGIRLALSLAGIAAGALLALIYLAVWHWTFVFVVWSFGVHSAMLIHIWDLIFIGILFVEGYRYQSRMPPKSPFTNAQAFIAIKAVGLPLFTPAQAAFSLSEMLYIAPRFFFWGFNHLRRAPMPAIKLRPVINDIYEALCIQNKWVPFDELQQYAESQRDAARAVAALVRAELATARQKDDVISVKVSQPEWV